MDIGSLLVRARALVDTGRAAEAVHVLQSAAQRQPEYPDVHNLLGLALSLAGEPLRAESHLRRALELHPAYAEAHLNLAILLYERSAYVAARDHLREFSRLVDGQGQGLPEPALDDLARRHAELGERYRAYGLLPEAEEACRRALELRPGYRDLRLRYARLLFDRTKLGEAAEQVAHLLRQDPGYADALLLRGRLELAAGRPEAARAAWSQVRGGPAATQARALLEALDATGRPQPGSGAARRLAGGRP